MENTLETLQAEAGTKGWEDVTIAWRMPFYPVIW